MDFITASEAYGYEIIAEAEEKELAAKYEEGVEYGREEGIVIGMERGREEGRSEGIEIDDLNARREMAKALKNNGASLDLIANVSGLSEEEIQIYNSHFQIQASLYAGLFSLAFSSLLSWNSLAQKRKASSRKHLYI